MSAAGSYAPLNVSDRSAPPPPDSPRPKPAPDDLADPSESPEGEPVATDRIDLSSLSIAGITRRHVAWIAAGLISAWIVVIFARQVGDAAAASSRAAQLVADNAALAAEVR